MNKCYTDYSKFNRVVRLLLLIVALLVCIVAFVPVILWNPIKDFFKDLKYNIRYEIKGFKRSFRNQLGIVFLNRDLQKEKNLAWLDNLRNPTYPNYKNKDEMWVEKL